MKGDLLSVKRLSVSLREVQGRVILDNVSLAVPQGAIVGIVGGSGSGKTTLGLSALGLFSSAMTVTSGGVLFEGQDILYLPAQDLRRLRGGRIGVVFQEPQSAFDPVFSVGEQIAETILAHEAVTKAELEQKVLTALERAGVPDAVRVARSYPHELSGGLRQRAMIAQAISCGPSLLIADEPTSSLDVTLQAHIMELFRDLRRELGLSIVLISHDLGMVARLADEVAVMCEGKIVERAEASRIMSAPQHTYAKRLVEAGS